MNPILIQIGPIKIYWYSIMILLGVLIAYTLIVKEAKQKNISENTIIDLFFITIPIALIGARIYFVIFEWNYYSTHLNEIIQVWNGGLAIHGGILAGLITILLFCKKRKINIIELLDMIVIGLLIGQVIGRWGNFFNGEAYGPITTPENLKYLPKFIREGMYIDGFYREPTFLYESVWNLIGCIIILLNRKNKKIKTGYRTAFYLIWYGIGRFAIESLRTDSLMLGTIKIAQLVSLSMIVIGIILFTIKTKKKE